MLHNTLNVVLLYHVIPRIVNLPLSLETQIHVDFNIFREIYTFQI